jgi:hypothetical protein
MFWLMTCVMKCTLAMTNEMDLTSAGLASNVAEHRDHFATARSAIPGDLRILDTFVLALFSAVYEMAVILLRFRSRLSD